MEKTEKSEIKKIDKSMTDFVVIGLGRFGKTIATTLADLGKEVLAIDKNEQLVRDIEEKVSTAVVADSCATGVLRSLGIQNFDCAIICIGDDLESSILSTLICKELDVPYVVAKAKNEQHKKVLDKIGADMVIFPEVFMGKKLANMLTNPSRNDIMSLTDNYKITEIATPDAWQNKTIGDLNIRQKYKVSILFVKRDNEVINPDTDTLLQTGDILVTAGDLSKIDSLITKSSEVIDANHILQDVLQSE